MSKSRISGVVITAMLALGLSTAPAFAVAPDDSAITIGNSNCDLSSAFVGAGTSADPYLIGTEKELAELNDCIGGDYLYVVLTADIDLTPSSDSSKSWNDTGNGGWTPIGNSNTSFQGQVYGNHHTISNLTINRTDNYQGLFGDTYTARIKNLTITGSITVPSDYDYIGALVGNADYLTATDIHTDVDISTESDYVGGVVGYLDIGVLTDLVVDGDLTGTYYGSTARYWGGIAGESQEASITRATVNGNIDMINEDPNNAGSWSDGYEVGGIVGYNDGSSITYSTMNGDVTATQYVAGIQAYGWYGIIDNVTMNGDVISDNTGNHREISYVGGIVGYYEDGGISNAKMLGDVTISADDTDADQWNQDSYYIGGIAGYLEYAALSDASFEGALSLDADGTADANEIGGIVGYTEYTGYARVSNTGTMSLENAYQVGGIFGYGELGVSVVHSVNTADVTIDSPLNNENAQTGGIGGYADDGVLIDATSNTGDVTVTSASNDGDQVGGIIGYVDDSVAIQNSYNRGNVSGTNYVGGFIGEADSEETEISNSFTTGTVTATDTSDVAVGNGLNSFSEALADTYLGTSVFDSETTGATSSVTNIEGRTTAEMKTQSTFEDLGWSIGTEGSIWSIDADHNDGYPYIAAAPAADNSGGGSGGGGGSSASATRDLLGPIAFKKGSAKLSAKAKLKLAVVASALKAGGYDKVTLKSFTKSTNTKLAVKRNKAVVKYLKAHGVKVKLYKEAVTRSSKKKNNKVYVVAVKNAVV